MRSRQRGGGDQWRAKYLHSLRIPSSVNAVGSVPSELNSSSNNSLPSVSSSRLPFIMEDSPDSSPLVDLQGSVEVNSINSSSNPIPILPNQCSFHAHAGSNRGGGTLGSSRHRSGDSGDSEDVFGYGFSEMDGVLRSKPVPFSSSNRDGGISGSLTGTESENWGDGHSDGTSNSRSHSHVVGSASSDNTSDLFPSPPVDGTLSSGEISKEVARMHSGWTSNDVAHSIPTEIAPVFALSIQAKTRSRANTALAGSHSEPTSNSHHNPLSQESVPNVGISTSHLSTSFVTMKLDNDTGVNGVT